MGLFSVACGKKSEDSKASIDTSRPASQLASANTSAKDYITEAVTIGDVASTQAAINRGANVDLMLPNGSSLLTYAITNNFGAVVTALLSGGADHGRVDRHGKAPLLVAMFHQRSEMARELIANGALINSRDSQGRSILMLAIEQLDSLLAEWLMDQGADLDIIDNEGKTAATLAREVGLDALVRAIDLRVSLTEGVSSEELLRQVFQQTDVEGLRIALQRSPSILRIPMATSPLFQAIQGVRTSKITEMVQLILDQGISPDGQASDPRSPLSEAAARGLPEIIEMLARRGAPIEQRCFRLDSTSSRRQRKSAIQCRQIN